MAKIYIVEKDEFNALKTDVETNYQKKTDAPQIELATDTDIEELFPSSGGAN